MKYAIVRPAELVTVLT